MACSNCFNGCADIISDQCVKYTGVDIDELDIKTGDPLLVVENKITDKIMELMDGSGIIPKLVPTDICALVQTFIPCCPPIDLNDILTALIKTVCALDVRLAASESKLLALNADYVIGCLPGVTTSSDTHEIVQSIITKLCQTVTGLATLEAYVNSTFVKTEDIDDIVGGIVSGSATTTKYNTRMVPWVAYPIFVIPDGAFDINGVGINTGAWEKIYICNGKSKNGIPDLRGRTIVGSTAMGPAPYDIEIDPTNTVNPVWALFEKKGVNVVPLTINQMPSHSHPVAVTVNQTPHNHTGTAAGPYIGPNIQGGGGFDGDNENIFRERAITLQPASVNLNITATTEARGGIESHPNIQPGMGAYYIMYIP